MINIQNGGNEFPLPIMYLTADSESKTLISHSPSILTKALSHSVLEISAGHTVPNRQTVRQTTCNDTIAVPHSGRPAVRNTAKADLNQRRMSKWLTV